MSEQCPKDDDAVLGDLNKETRTRAVLGGIEGARLRFEQATFEEKLLIIKAIGEKYSRVAEANEKAALMIDEIRVKKYHLENDCKTSLKELDETFRLQGIRQRFPIRPEETFVTRKFESEIRKADESIAEILEAIRFVNPVLARQIKDLVALIKRPEDRNSYWGWINARIDIEITSLYAKLRGEALPPVALKLAANYDKKVMATLQENLQNLESSSAFLPSISDWSMVSRA